MAHRSVSSRVGAADTIRVPGGRGVYRPGRNPLGGWSAPHSVVVRWGIPGSGWLHYGAAGLTWTVAQTWDSSARSRDW